MRRIRSDVWLFVLLPIVLLVGVAQAQFSSFPPGTFNSRAALDKSGSAPAFQGMADIVASPAVCWSLRACSSATRGTRAANVCNVADAACADLSTDATTGALVITTIGGSSCSVVVCTVKILYDQTVGTTCGGSPCDVTNATIANRPVLVVSCINSLPCMTFVTASGQFLASTATSPSLSQPFTVSAVADRTGAATTTSIAGISSTGADPILAYSANVATVYAGTPITRAATDNHFHALQGVYNSPNCVVNVDGTGTTADCNTGGITLANSFLVGNDGFNDFFEGKITEVGWWFSAFNGTQQTNMNSNQTAYWGPF